MFGDPSLFIDAILAHVLGREQHIILPRHGRHRCQRPTRQRGGGRRTRPASAARLLTQPDSCAAPAGEAD
ncbi:hypothetical protein STXM2123_3955 [Streptomyces sp. F-3]|nr:hypothetical protein STXM2123_3955 [Streptomyces sp. F-3]